MKKSVKSDKPIPTPTPRRPFTAAEVRASHVRMETFKGRHTWIRIFCDQTLRGTTFRELEPDERFVWFGFLLLAGDSPFGGFICINADLGYTDAQLAAMLKVPVELLKRAKRKCEKWEKIRVLENNVIEVLNWSKYQSEYRRQLVYRQGKKVSPSSEVTNEGDKGGLQERVTGAGYKGGLYRQLEREGEGEREEEREKTPQEGGEDSLPPIPEDLPFELKDPLAVAWAEYHLALKSKSPMGPTNAEAHRREYLKLWNALPPKYKLLQKDGGKEDK